MFPKVLKSQRLVLRPPANDDAAVLVQLLNNWNVVKNLALAPYPYTSSDAEVFLERSGRRTITEDNVVYAIAIDEKLLGVISVTPQSRGPSLGYWLGEPYWRQGFMTEAVGAVVSTFFRVPANRKLTSGIFVGNDASLAVQRKFGFEVVGERMALCVARGVEIQHLDTALTRERYEELLV